MSDSYARLHYNEAEPRTIARSDRSINQHTLPLALRLRDFHFRSWHKCEVSQRPLYRRFRPISGSDADIVKPDAFESIPDVGLRAGSVQILPRRPVAKC